MNELLSFSSSSSFMLFLTETVNGTLGLCPAVNILMPSVFVNAIDLSEKCSGVLCGFLSSLFRFLFYSFG